MATMKKAMLVVRRLSESGQHGYLVLGKTLTWTTDPKDAHRFDNMLAAMRAVCLAGLDEGYDFVYMR
jgi:hypothetical protein